MIKKADLIKDVQEILMRASRRKRACGEKKYLEWDLEEIEELAEKILISSGYLKRESQDE